MAIGSTYCTQRDVEDIYPNINDYDSKEAIYGWTTPAVGDYDQALKDKLHKVYNTGLVTVLYLDGQEMTNVANDSTMASDWYNNGQDGHWTYYIESDRLEFYHESKNPNDSLMEAGEDWNTLIARTMQNASRYFDSRVDRALPRDQWKDKEGNYDYIIIRTVALITACFLIKAYDPENHALASFEEEYNLNLALINSGQVAISNQVTSDSSKGTLREVTAPANANPLRIVDTRGNYSGIYDLIKIVISTGGAIGTAKFDVYSKSSTGLKTEKVLDGEIINGQYQTIGNGLQVRFAGKDDDAIATAGGTPDEWEIEVWGINEMEDVPVIKSIRMTRRN